MRQGQLLDYYGALLNDHKREIFESYVNYDLSLGEISENVGISRQGVHDLIRRCTEQMEDYEAKLGLIKRAASIRKEVQTIDGLLGTGEDAEGIRRHLRKITEEL